MTDREILLVTLVIVLATTAIYQYRLHCYWEQFGRQLAASVMAGWEFVPDVEAIDLDELENDVLLTGSEIVRANDVLSQLRGVK